jgi:colanic acid biosynthesis glycosyl transferase WcaI
MVVRREGAFADTRCLPRTAISPEADLRPRVVVFSELYWPEDTSTGFFVTGIAEGLAEEREVLVFCAQPTYGRRGLRSPPRERHQNVEIHRVTSTTFAPHRPLGRALNSLTITGALSFHALRRLRADDQVLVVTNPPLLPYSVMLAARLRRAQCALLVHDVYPEVLEAAGTVGRHGLIARAIRRMARWLYRSAHRVVVLGRDMEALVATYLDGATARVTVIPNWGDVDEITPSPRNENALLTKLHLEAKFVVQWLGNMGRTHALEALLLAAARLRENAEVHFLFVGWGAKRAWMEREIGRRALDNVTLLPHCAREDLALYLGACDLAVIAFLPGMTGVSVPSRLYNVLASGRPLLAVAEPESELSLVIREEGVGWTVPPAESEGVATAIATAIATVVAAGAESRAPMGARARRAAESRYSRLVVIRSWRSLFAQDWRR